MPVEEQLLYNTAIWHAGTRPHIGQKLTIVNRKITKLGFWVHKQGAPGGNYYYVILDGATHAEVYSQVAGVKNDLATTPAFVEIELTTPQQLNGAYYIGVKSEGGDSADKIATNVNNADVKANEFVQWFTTSWADRTDLDTAYVYTYETGWTGKISGVVNPAKIMGVDVANIASVNGVASA
ncbi:hypothetical protein KKE60_07225 [Patescibacteria group bacterium]|nr:hypothetical protein [Patescibacteria group bacterium]